MFELVVIICTSNVCKNHICVIYSTGDTYKEITTSFECLTTAGSVACECLAVKGYINAGVFFSILNQLIFGYFDPIKIFVDHQNKQFSG